MNSRYCVVICLFILLLFSGVYCTSTGQQSEEEKIARSYCSSCHLFPEPSMLDKTTWNKGVLPKMASYFGISYLGNTFFVNDMDSPGTKIDTIDATGISYQKWSAIVDFYTNNAPEKLDAQQRAPIQQISDRFALKEVLLKGHQPTTTYVQIDPGNKQIYMGNEHDSLFCIFDKSGNLISKQNIHSVLVDVEFYGDLKLPGKRNGIATDIGIIYPNDLRRGTLKRFEIGANANFTTTSLISDKLPRPVQTTTADLDGDGKMDYLVCGFGYNTGAFYYMHQVDSNHYEQRILKAIPGAVKAYVDDYNKDGLPDIMVLFAQAQEGIFLYLNKGKGNFEIKEVIRFPSIYGSTYFELVDVNKDGLKDIVYSCGDNLDYSQVLKNYHGVYIYLNRGNNNYEKTWFFPIHGCYKAMARDFDNDGDIDIAAISYFPDVKSQPKEAIVYLENKGGLNFTATTMQGFHRGNWVTMDAGDVDGDGDEDIVIGSLIFNNTPRELTIGAGPGEMPDFLLLINQTK